MSNDASDLVELGAHPDRSDAELIAVVRGGDNAAFGELYQRHSVAAYGLARQLAPAPGVADDLVAEAFAKVLEALRNGRGPDVAFRAYLLTTLRHGLYDSSRRDKRLQFTDDLSDVDPGTPFVDTPIRDLEASLVARAFAALPERWQTILWHTEIEGQKPADVAPLLGLSANGAAALAYRAREGLRQAYLQAHLADSAQDDCRFTVERLGAWARDGLAKREKAKVQEHLGTCERCRALSGELADVNGGLRGIIAPLVLGGPFLAGYLAHLQAGAAAGAAAGGGVGGGSGASAGGSRGSGPGSAVAVGGSGRRTAILAVAAAALVALAGGTYALSRISGDSPGAQAGASLSALPAQPVRPSPLPPSVTAPTAPPTATPTNTAPATPTSTPTTAAPDPTNAPSTTTTPLGPPAPGASAPDTSPPPAASAPATSPVPATSPPPATSPSPALAALSVGVSLTFDSTYGESGTLSGAVGATPQVRLLGALPPGWAATMSGPCSEGGAATTVCTLSGAQGASSITVNLIPPLFFIDSVSVTVGLFADAGDAIPVDSF
jgi:RNA polymerase sigma factor (sigma-70 family)